MSATIQILASVIQHTSTALTVAGTECSNVRGEWRDLTFYHRVTRPGGRSHSRTCHLRTATPDRSGERAILQPSSHPLSDRLKGG